MDKTDIKVYEFDGFKKDSNIVHGVFARFGGTSTKPFDSLNIGMNSGDETSAIEKNRKLIILKMGMKPLIFLNQVHSDEIKILRKDDASFSIDFEPGRETYTADAIITDMTNVFLVIQVADCQAVMLYDSQKKVIANIHSGWRGSIKNIVGKTVDRMVAEFGCSPGDIQAGISPSLGPCCAEFINYKDEIPEDLWEYKAADKDYFDFWKMTRDQLTAKGVLEDNIENMNICTRCNSAQFYSYRAEKTTGRFACVISMI